uniref:Cell division cycle associated 7a n=1 Tax=Petromyzon marinus TaxID=7757 RepID=S4RUH4_PETMA
ELAKLFQDDSDTENDTFHGFTDSDVNSMESESDLGDSMEVPQLEKTALGETTPGRGRPFSLRVMLKFPAAGKRATGNSPTKNDNHKSSPPASEAELEQKMDFLTRRALNIKENKAMLARLMADLKTMPGLMGKFSIRSSTPSLARSAHIPVSDGPVRRNPERSTRTNARSLGLRSSSPTSSPHLSLEERLRYKRKSSDSDDDGDDEYRPQRRRSGFYSTSAIPHVVRSVDEITQDELTLIATCTSEKSYNKVNGSTCHQCRQKTSDTKTCCRNPECWGVRGQFCGPCLRNRYGEDVRAALLDPAWHCPSCRGICNCSFCRRREGRCATGILIHLAKYHGYNNVQAYLESLQKEIDDED